MAGTTHGQPVITVVGSFAVGMTIRAPRFPVPGETLIGREFDMGPGGKGSNQAVGAARLGATSHLVARIGRDLLGEIAVRLYAEEGVGTEHLTRVAEAATGVGLITLNEAGDNQIIIDLGANLLLSPADVDAAEAQIAASDLVAAVLEIPVDTAAHAMTVARRHGVPTLLNPAPAQPLDAAVLREVGVLTPNEGELRILLGLAPDDPTETPLLARRLQERGVRNLVVTRGARGALVIEESGAVTEIPGVPTEVVDTTGAGDAFNSALAVALAEGTPLVAAAQFATHAGALACTRLGVIPALPTRAAVEERCSTRI
jgi:ribokinase